MIWIDNLEWFDSYGNTYFSADVYLNNDLIMSMPMQYGYSEHCRQVFEMAFCKHFNINYVNAPGWVVRETLGKNGIKISVSTKNAKKRDLNKGKAFQDFSAFTKPENITMYAGYRFHRQIPFIGNKVARYIGHSHIIFNDGSDILLSNVNWF